jgi:hypothetical protein
MIIAACSFALVWMCSAQEPVVDSSMPGPSIAACMRTNASEVFEQDRSAILKMAGAFKVTFRFQETVGVATGYRLHDPYGTEAMELVEVVEDRGTFISLQHILVAPASDGGNPEVIKHWRQEWTYEDRVLNVFRGRRTWEHMEISGESVIGQWTQAVYEVDDSPRYESLGRWRHVGEQSTWESRETWRPLPRREYTKRHDYDVLLVRNRHTVTPAGWFHEQDNQKVLLDKTGNPAAVLAHEYGLNTYMRMEGDLFEARAHWERIAPFWAQVRHAWTEVLAQPGAITLKRSVDGRRLGESLNTLAESLSAEVADDASVKARIAAEIRTFVQTAAPEQSAQLTSD